jgi:hypothetical protein
MPHYRVTGYIRIDDEDMSGRPVFSDDIDLIVEAECAEDAVKAAAHLALEKGLLKLPEDANPDGWEFSGWELRRLDAVEVMAAEYAWHLRCEEEKVVRAQMEQHGCGMLFDVVALHVVA